MTTYDKLAEIAARGAYASDGWWRHAGDNDDGKGRYKMHGDVRLRAVEWDQLDADEHEDYLQQARAALAAINAAGYAFVPIKATEEMIAAGLEADIAGFNGPTTPVAHIWTAMLSAKIKTL